MFHLSQDLNNEVLNSEYPNIQKLSQDVYNQPNDIKAWDALFDEYDKIIDDSYDMNDRNSISQNLKDEVYKAYKSLLSRFPLLLAYWKKWSILEYKLNGTDASIDILRLGVENFPNSVQLWNDYLTASETVEKEGSREKMDKLLEEALRHNSYDYNSGPLWNKVIEFEKDNDEKVLELFLKVIRIPLYEYAQFYEKFQETCKKFEIGKIIPEKDLLDYVKKFGKSKIIELSLIEKHQIIDDYITKIYSITQAKVNSSWQYESNLRNQEFKIVVDQEIKDEIETWLNYIRKEIEVYKNDNSDGQFNLICNLFERMLIPNCFNSDSWLKYLKFLNDSRREDSFELQKEVYLKINSRFIPLNKQVTRFMYVKLLLKHDKLDDALEYLLDWIKLYSGIKLYFKQSYLESITELVKMIQHILDMEEFRWVLKKWINMYFDITPSKKKQEEEVKIDKIPMSVINQVAKYLNDDSICIIIESHLLQLQAQDQTEKIRQFYNQHHTRPCLSISVKFWNFMFQFEGIHQHNLNNLKLIITYIKNESNLPKLVIDQFINQYYDIANANLKKILLINDGKSDESIIKRDLNISNSIFYNTATQKRSSEYNYMLKHNNNKLKQDEYIRFIRKQIGHPGIFIDSTPDITNKFMNDGNYIDLTENDIPIPPLPTFKNVEKASQNIKYPKD
ncbi:unnamed protein product [Candida verbasci]|uniref:Uncharacterized protein n=1 Tax=Candida verbasci TaxID=1227364 RepID=A0A9W4XK44_9ASCO|nr:unnamed protein product [Candida verbasci]